MREVGADLARHRPDTRGRRLEKWAVSWRPPECGSAASARAPRKISYGVTPAPGRRRGRGSTARRSRRPARRVTALAIWAISWPRAVSTKPARPWRDRVHSRSSTARVSDDQAVQPDQLFRLEWRWAAGLDRHRIRPAPPQTGDAAIAGRTPHADDLGGRCDVAEGHVHLAERCLVAVTAEIGTGVARGDDVVIVEEAVACGRLDASTRGVAAHDECADAVAPQDQIEVGPDERAVAVLGDDHLADTPSGLMSS